MASSTTNARDLEQIVRDGLSSLVFAFGHKTGIVDAFTEIQQPCTAEELSQKAGKKLRNLYWKLKSERLHRLHKLRILQEMAS
uniref:Uncharacterized protein n=1 Tax=Magallana gigas TaxID=29159 RepID=K1RCE0_MAGGI